MTKDNNRPQPQDSIAREAEARKRYFIITFARLAGVAGAIFGLVIIGHSEELPDKIIGTALVLSALVEMAVVPRALARQWRTPTGDDQT